jgi:predicted permease
MEELSDCNYIVTGQPKSQFNSRAPSAEISIVSEAYFDTLGIGLRAGRAFSGRDTQGSGLTAIVNQALAKHSFPEINPLGQQLFFGYTEDTLRGVKIVGVVAEARLDGPREPVRPRIYLPYLQFSRGDMHLLIATRGNPLNFAQPVRNIIFGLDREATVKLTTMDAHLATTVAEPRFNSFLLSAFAGLAMLLAAVGVYGVMAYSVSQRTTEIGLRMALGAKQMSVVGMVMAEALRLAGAGLVIGLFGAMWASRLLRAQLFGVSSGDPAVFAGMLGLILAVALTAAFIPALRASKVEPSEALRQD